MKHEIHIENLKCGGCSSTIKKGLLTIDGVEEIEIKVESSIVYFSATEEKLTQVIDKLSKLGYPVVGNENTIVHKAKSFVSCAVGRVSSDKE